MAASLKNNPAAWLAQQWPTDEVGRFAAVEAAFSGGLDSAVLLHLLWRIARTDGRPLSAVHVCHNISPNAQRWAAFCRKVCADYGIPLREESVHVNPAGAGWEAAARRERYACFANGAAAVTALAHHADDQSETLLLALLRGGGLRALSAMPERRVSEDGRILWRPLLPFSRAELAAYAAEHGLAWVEDESNADVRLLRNRLRRDVMPVLADAVPNVNRQFAAALGHLQRDLALLREYAQADAAAVYDGAGRFRVSACLRLPPLRRQEQLCGFARRHGLGLPPTASVERFSEVLAGGAVQARWTLPHGEAAVYGDCLFPVAAGRQAVADACSGYLKAVWKESACGIAPEKAAGAGYWRAARADDRLPLPDGGRKRLSCLLREQRVPPFLRGVWPVWADAADGVCLAAANMPLPSGSGGVLPYFPVLEAWRGSGGEAV